jgi:hypothetical protein
MAGERFGKLDGRVQHRMERMFGAITPSDRLTRSPRLILTKPSPRRGFLLFPT